MSDPIWQTIVVAVLLAVAAIYLIRRVIKRRRSEAGCANCAVADAAARRRH